MAKKCQTKGYMKPIEIEILLGKDQNNINYCNMN